MNLRNLFKLPKRSTVFFERNNASLAVKLSGSAASPHGNSCGENSSSWKGGICPSVLIINSRSVL